MKQISEQEQYQVMTETPIARLVPRLAVPTMVSMVITGVYNMADTYFVSKLGTSASGAVGVVFSLMAIIQAIGFTLGLGSGSIISRLLGRQRREEAEEIANTGLFVAILCGVLLAVFGSLSVRPMMLLLGATDTMLPYAVDYGRYILYASPVMCVSFVLSNLLRAEGKAKFSMIGIAFGGVLNIVLDPLFIFTFGFQTAGAAMATALSQLISCGILLLAYLRGSTILRLRPAAISRRGAVYLMILKDGLPSLTRQGLASISTVALNRGARLYGDAAVAAMGIVGKVFMLIFSVLIGFCQGYQPVAGYNYGAKKFGRLRGAFRFTLLMGMAIMSVLAAVGFVFAPQIVGLVLKSDPQVVSIGARAFRMQCAALPLLPLMITCNMTFQSTGRALWATLTSSLRQGIVFLPIILILPAAFGLTGIEAAQAVSDLISVLLCIPFMVAFFRRLRETER